MTQVTTLVLTDQSGDLFSFVPRDISSGVATLAQSAGVPLGEKTVSYAVTRTSTGRRKVTMKMAIPVVQDIVVNGISKPTVVRTAYADFTITVDGTSNTTEREDLLAFIRGVFADTSMIAPAIIALSPPF